MLPATFPRWAILFTAQLSAIAAIAAHIIVTYALFPQLGSMLEVHSGIHVLIMSFEILASTWLFHSKIFMADIRKSLAAKKQRQMDC